MEQKKETKKFTTTHIWGIVLGAILGCILGLDTGERFGSGLIGGAIGVVVGASVGYRISDNIRSGKTNLMRFPAKQRNLMFIALIIFIGAMTFVVFMLDKDLQPPWSYVVVAMPALSMLFAVYAIGSAIAHLDEMQRNIQLQGISIAFGGTLVVTFAYGLLDLIGVPQVSWLYVPLVMAVMLVIGKLSTVRRY
jgi:hypothetical protein